MLLIERSILKIFNFKIFENNSRDRDAAAVLPAPCSRPEAHSLVVRCEHALDPHRLVRVLQAQTKYYLKF